MPTNPSTTEPGTGVDPDIRQDGDEGQSRWVTGDDERENREHIAETGEPKRDALGNADGAS